jgi:hypothetical protein
MLNTNPCLAWINKTIGVNFMKQNKIKTLVLLFLVSTLTLPIHAQLITHDPINNIPIVSGWLTAVDTLYSNYDMVMNTVTQIENQYKAIQQAIDNAKNIDWDNIKFDGDFDIRDDIKDANKRINALLSQANAIKDTLSTTIISTDGHSYSLADICGFGDEGKSFGSCVTDVYSHMKSSVLEAATAACGTLTEAQEQAIWTKYGISPKNYYLVAQTSKAIKAACQKNISAATDKAIEMVRQEKLSKLNAVVQAALSAKTADGTIPQGALNEASLIASQQMVDGLMTLQEAVEYAAAATSQKLIAEEQQKEIEASEKYSEQASNDIIQNNLPGSFVAGHTKTIQK